MEKYFLKLRVNIANKDNISDNDFYKNLASPFPKNVVNLRWYN